MAHAGGRVNVRGLVDNLHQLVLEVVSSLGIDPINVMLWAGIIVWLWAMRAYLRTVL